MSIQGNIGQNVLDLNASGVDTVLLDFNERVAVSQLSLFNVSGSNATITIYVSPDLTSASGKLVATEIIPSQESWGPKEIIGQGYGPEENLIVVNTTVGALIGDVNAKLTYIEYTGSS